MFSNKMLLQPILSLLNISNHLNKKNEIILLLIGIVSYLYLYVSLLNEKYNIIFIYFASLFIGYLIIGKSIYLYNLIIILLDIINNKLILREGNSNFNKSMKAGTDKAKKQPEFQKEGGSSDITKDSSKEEGNDIVESIHDKPSEKQEKLDNAPDIKKAKEKSKKK